jgi:hypothetical protein
MYCSSCGVECVAGLSYCNRCGANLNPAAITTQVVQTGSVTKPIIILSATILALTLGGFTIIFIAASELARNLLNVDAVNLTIIFGMVTILLADIQLIRLLSRIINNTMQPKAVAPIQPLPAQFAPATHSARQLASTPPDYVMPSVTEHTTRTLTPSYKEPHA